MRLKTAFALAITGCIAGAFAQEAFTGSLVKPTGAEQKALDGIKGKIKGKIVWSTSRSNSKHDLWLMNADGSDQKQLTKGDNVDWFSRFSPDGQTVVFTRSKTGWVPEADAEMAEKWDVWTIRVDGSDEKKVAENACWGSWKDANTIIYARGTKVLEKDLSADAETEIFDAEVSIKKGTYSQEPQISANGKFLAITLRGTTRETGIWDLANKSWATTGGGCQITWFPDNKRVLRMNEGQGNGGTEVLAITIDDAGKPVEKLTGLAIPKEIKFMDLVGRRSHEYFPKVDNSGKWMIWCATQYGHEHDLYDYEVYVWDITTDKKNGPVRLTFHDGNDRWPDLFTE